MAFTRKDRWAVALGRLRIALGGEVSKADTLARSQDRIMQARDAFERASRAAPRGRPDIQLAPVIFPAEPETQRVGRAASHASGMDSVFAGHLIRYAETHFERGDRISGQFALEEARRCEVRHYVYAFLGGSPGTRFVMAHSG